MHSTFIITSYTINLTRD